MKTIISKLIQRYQKNKSLIGTVLKYACVVGITIFLSKLFCNPSPITSTVVDNIAEVKKERDKNGKLIAIIEQKDVDLRNSGLHIDSLAKALKVKPKQIKGVDRTVSVIDTIWRDSIVYISGPDSTIISRKDPWVSIRAIGKPSGSSIAFRLTPDTVYRTSVTKNPLFGRPTTENYLSHSNPYVVTTHGDSYVDKQPRAIATLSISVGYDVFNNRVFGGPAIGLPIKTFYSKR